MASPKAEAKVYGLLVRGEICTPVVKAVFVAIWIWAWRPRHKQAFDATARLALDDDAAAIEDNNTNNNPAGKAEPHA